ncbi:MAG: TIGR03016 family PEP-CTERM system-associated outer membrane protein [Burkholderiales bacterium]|nr:TIGR03016 family PEP-CTERM system-associated outer membrane protein [Burkholderiales bacterium]
MRIGARPIAVARATAWLGAALVAAPAARAQDAVAKPGFSIAPSLTIQETLTNNRDLTRVPAQADLVTQLSPGLRINSHTARLDGTLYYALAALSYARAPRLNTVQHYLDTSFVARGFDDHFSMKTVGSIAQQSISAYGVQSGSNDVVNTNRTQVSNLSVAPTLNGNIAGYANVSLGLNGSTTRAKATPLGSYDSYGGNLAFGGRSGNLGWGLQLSQQTTTYKLGGKTHDQPLVLSGDYFVDYDLKLSLQAGRDRTDALTGTTQSFDTWGWGVEWHPTDRTDVLLQDNKTFYGRSHTITLRHRMQRSVWSYVDTSGINGNPATLGANAKPLTFYDLLYNICLAQGLDALTCQQQAQAYFAANPALDPNQQLGGFLASGTTIQRSQNLSVAVSGLRTTVTLSLFRNGTHLVNAGAPTAGDLANNKQVRQDGETLAISQRLSETASLTLSLSQLRTLATVVQPSSRQRNANLVWTGSLNRFLGYSLGLRHTNYASAITPYEESAVIGSLSLRY